MATLLAKRKDKYLADSTVQYLGHLSLKPSGMMMGENLATKTEVRLVEPMEVSSGMMMEYYWIQ
jgi:hypothetical protein